ncbi:ABC transporter ATP-binding protein [Limnohabitans sp. 2KL-51]|uniref:ABC transporter ATP-binding protein n=1 Tax=Limnohabitans sp. 2KL-51 TaxID=1977911 RepID=UPI000D3C6EDD|nr:ABC transporter ATP-binding protein [Limnohabitans sp. 2KL-51]PUE44408.1 ABC transporter ATP-binding protein [Limnohabitans sp. 2KL-51]
MIINHNSEVETRLGSQQKFDVPVLECRGVERYFGGLHALKGVDLTIASGSIVGLVGPNGSGKTTLVNVVTGFYPPQVGSVRLFGQEITGLQPYKVAQRSVARTFQNLALFRGMSVLDNILLGRHVHMRPSALASLFYWVWAAKEEIAHREVVEDVIDFLQLQDIRDEPVESIPPGLQKRVELARALASEPRFLILDEPMAGMNQEEKEYIARFILDTRDERGVTILLIEHHMDVVTSICDEVLVLSNGEAIASGEPRSAISSPQVVEAYLGKRGAQRSGVVA